MSEPYFAPGYLRLLCRFMRVEQVPAADLLRATDFSEPDLMRADIDIPFAVQMRICQNAVAHSAPGLGLRLGPQLQLAAHGALGTALQSAADLQTALNTFIRFVAMRASFFSLSLSVVGEQAKISIDIRDLPADLLPFFSESILFALTHCVTFYTGKAIGVSEIRLAYPAPDYHPAYVPNFGGPIQFDCEHTRITFDSALLSLQSPEADSRVFAESIRRCQDQMNQHQTVEDVAAGIQTFLLANPGKLWSLQEIAPLFAKSPRTLIRRLKEANTTYQILRDEALKQQAILYLQSMSVEATAISLGFADPSSFRRTFKRWFGVTPSVFADRFAVQNSVSSLKSAP